MNLLKSEEEFEQALEDAKKIDELDHSYPGIHKTIQELERLQKEKFEKMKNEVMGKASPNWNAPTTAILVSWSSKRVKRAMPNQRQTPDPDLKALLFLAIAQSV
jgi:hypothetical protein